jgi:hypothetical protein
MSSFCPNRIAFGDAPSSRRTSLTRLRACSACSSSDSEMFATRSPVGVPHARGLRDQVAESQRRFSALPRRLPELLGGAVVESTTRRQSQSRAPPNPRDKQAQQLPRRMADPQTDPPRARPAACRRGGCRGRPRQEQGGEAGRRTTLLAVGLLTIVLLALFCARVGRLSLRRFLGQGRVPGRDRCGGAYARHKYKKRLRLLVTLLLLAWRAKWPLRSLLSTTRFR